MEITTYSLVIFTSMNCDFIYIVYSLMLATAMNMQVTVSRINYTFGSNVTSPSHVGPNTLPV